MPDKQRGLYRKYKVERTDGKPLGTCIVLEFTDKIARKAIYQWAMLMRHNGYERVYQDVVEELAKAYEGDEDA